MANHIINRIITGEFRNIIVVTGAGISTNAGIPDYRSKNGIFAELMKEFPAATSPQDLFSRSFVTKYNVYNHPIYRERVELIKSATLTASHILCKWFHDKGWLKRVYTQNIDGLHQKTGLPDEMIVEYHGSLIKGNVVLYGDNIPHEAIYQTILDFNSQDNNIDLMLVMGTSLQVAPFCAIPNLVNKHCTRILIDLHPQNAFTNNWTKHKVIPENMYDNYSISSQIKIGKRLVSLRPQWGKHSKWKDQYIITSDTDSWSNQIIIN